MSDVRGLYLLADFRGREDDVEEMASILDAAGRIEAARCTRYALAGLTPPDWVRNEWRAIEEAVAREEAALPEPEQQPEVVEQAAEDTRECEGAWFVTYIHHSSDYNGRHSIHKSLDVLYVLKDDDGRRNVSVEMGDRITIYYRDLGSRVTLPWHAIASIKWIPQELVEKYHAGVTVHGHNLNHPHGFY